jgi:hypothetical protein
LRGIPCGGKAGRPDLHFLQVGAITESGIRLARKSASTKKPEIPLNGMIRILVGDGFVGRLHFGALRN